MSDKAKKVNVVTKSRMLLGGKLVDAGTAAEISQEMYDNHKSHFVTQAQSQKVKKSKELQGENDQLKADLAKSHETNEALKGENEQLKAKLAESGSK